MGLILRQDKGSKLTYVEMDGNFTYLRDCINYITDDDSSFIGITSLSLTDAQTLVSNSSVIPGQIYIISGVDISLYGGTNILINGLSTNQFSPNGIGQFYNPQYLNFPVWDYNGSYNINDVVIYGGTLWQNLTGSTGTSVDYFTLETTDWISLPPTGDNISSYYNISWDEITYDFADDFISSRHEIVSNNRVSITYETRNWFFCGFNPIAVFRWGDPYNGSRGIGSCNIEDSYFECLNNITGSIQAITLLNYSIFGAYQLIGSNPYLEDILVTNGSSIVGLTIDSSSLYNISINNNSDLGELNLTNTSIYQITINNYSQFYNCTFTGSSIYNLNMNNESSFQGTTLSNSNVYYLELTNSSYWNNITLTNSNMDSITTNGSYIYGINITSSSFELSTLIGSGLSTIVGTNLYINNQSLQGFYLYMGDFGTINNLTFSSTDYHYNTIRYQGQFGFNGDSGAGSIGSVTIPLIPVPYGFYIERGVIQLIDGTKADGDDPVFTMGLSVGNSSCIVNSTNGVFSNLNNKIWYFDLSNGEVSYTVNPADNYQQILASVATNTITGGTIYYEITLKNINYSYIND